MRNPKFKVGQVVFWGNGKNRYYRVTEVLPIHCAGGAQAYYVRANDRHDAEVMERYASAFTEGPVSEEVLRPLLKEEIHGAEPSRDHCSPREEPKWLTVIRNGLRKHRI